MRYLICYDIEDNKNRTKLFERLKDFGEDVNIDFDALLFVHSVLDLAFHLKLLR